MASATATASSRDGDASRISTTTAPAWRTRTRRTPSPERRGRRQGGQGVSARGQAEADQAEAVGEVAARLPARLPQAQDHAGLSQGAREARAGYQASQGQKLFARQRSNRRQLRRQAGSNTHSLRFVEAPPRPGPSDRGRQRGEIQACTSSKVPLTGRPAQPAGQRQGSASPSSPRACHWTCASSSGGEPRSSHVRSARRRDQAARRDAVQRRRDRRALAAHEVAEHLVREAQAQRDARGRDPAPALGEVPEQHEQPGLDRRELEQRLVDRHRAACGRIARSSSALSTCGHWPELAPEALVEHGDPDRLEHVPVHVVARRASRRAGGDGWSTSPSPSSSVQVVPASTTSRASRPSRTR